MVIRHLLCIAIAAAVLLPAESTLAQQPYYYQPPPDYYHNDTAAGTVTGGALGAITGAIVGGRKNRGEGALIGAGVGAITGNLLGRSKDRADQQRAATGAAYVAQANQQAVAQAVTNYDLVSMTRAGVGDDLIISTMQSRGARLNLSPSELISLKQQGVSDRVLLAAQNMPSGSGYSARPVAVVDAPPPPRTVFIEPDPWPYWHYRGCYGPRYHSHIHFGGRW